VTGGHHHQRHHHQGHDHGHDDGGSRADGRRLVIVLVMVVGYMIAEVIGGVISGSLALLADAGHMLSDAGALVVTLLAFRFARRPASETHTFGYRRAEILAALANGVALVVLAGWIAWEAAGRLDDTPEVDGGWVLALGVAGLLVNLAAARVLQRAGGSSLNVRAALRHVLADLLSSVGVVVSAVLVLALDWSRADPVVSLFIAALILASAWGVLRESVGILLESAPRGIDPVVVREAILAVPGVVGVHDFHVWTITSGFPSLSAHVIVEPGADCHALRRVVEVELQRRFGLDHTTLQVEHAPGLVQLRR
jgi:cobalt-zinc-cadmium efflux system protein